MHRALPILIAALALPAGAAGQGAEVRIRENLRAEPGGDVVAVLDAGTPLRILERRDGWLQVEVEGWVWLQSLRARDGGAFDLVVAAGGGENLRAEPSGAILGRLGQGTLLEELERTPGWARTRRVAWIWAESVAAEPGARAAQTTPTPARTTPSPPAASAPSPAAPRDPATILDAPNGDTLAWTRPGASLQVLARNGDWARVRMEGWAWMPQGASADDGPVDASPSELAADPDRYRGRLVSWELQFLSLERAERIRTDFFEGEPFLLTRDASGGYVYVALPPERLASALTLTPLERVTVLGRVRTAASALTGSPILDLVELTRARSSR